MQSRLVQVVGHGHYSSMGLFGVRVLCLGEWGGRVLVFPEGIMLGHLVVGLDQGCQLGGRG